MKLMGIGGIVIGALVFFVFGAACQGTPSPNVNAELAPDVALSTFDGLYDVGEPGKTRLLFFTFPG